MMRMFAVQIDETGIAICELTKEGVEEMIQPGFEGSDLWGEWDGGLTKEEALERLDSEFDRQE